MKHSSCLHLFCAASLLLLAGCAETKYVPQGSSKLVVNPDQVNIQDFEQAADAMINSLIDQMINTGRLKSSSPPEPALLGISSIVNRTGAQLETDLLVKKIRIALNRTGKVQTSTTIGLGEPEDPLAADVKAAQETGENKKPARLPDYTLSGKIIEVAVKAGNVHQSSFVFQLSLSSVGGIAVWEEETTITKQGKRGTIGF